jgi:O-6-methylguanine DNA methyltransferase
LCAYGAIPLVIGITNSDAVCRLAFARAKILRSVPAAWKKSWAQTTFIHDEKAIAPIVKALNGNRHVKLEMIGTVFQCAVWRNLLAIPSGDVVTYAELARRCGNPKAVRAVGSACGANPIAILVPCHRVIASDGSLGGFAGGLAVKKKLLQAEGLQQL